MKHCKLCNQLKSLEDFATHKDTKDGRRADCKECRSHYNREYQKKNREKIRQYKLELKYGMRAGQYQEMLERQNGLCAICGSDNEGKYLFVDHCHSTGQVRGLLCSRCNLGLGYFKDNTDSMEKAVEYLINSTKPLAM